MKTLKQIKTETKKAINTYTMTAHDIQAVSDMVNLIGKAETLRLDRDKLVIEIAENFARLLGDNPSYEQWAEVVNALTIQSIKQLKIAESTFKNYLTDIYKNCEVMFDLVKPKKQSASAQSMSKLRETLAEKTDAELKDELQAHAKNLDFTKAKQIQGEIKRRDKQAETEQKRAEGKATTELKNSLKKWIGKLNPSELACLVYVRENFDKIEKLSKAN